MNAIQCGETANITASTSVKTGPGKLIGIFVASSSSGTIKLWDNTAGSGKVLVNTFSAVGATWYPIPIRYSSGLFVTTGGTIDCTVVYV